MDMPLMEVLPHVPLFEGLPFGMIESLSGAVVVRERPVHWTVFRQGRRCTGLHVVLSGAVKIYRSGPGGHEQILYIERPKHVFGESALFNGMRWTASAMALEPVELVFLPIQSLRSLFDSCPGVSVRLLEEMGRHIDALTCKLDKLSLRDLDGRVAIQIMEEATHAGGCEDGCAVTLSRTQEELASELGTTRESLARALRHLREAGAIDQDGPCIRVLDRPLLVEIAGGEECLPPCASAGRCGDGLVRLS